MVFEHFKRIEGGRIKRVGLCICEVHLNLKKIKGGNAKVSRKNSLSVRKKMVLFGLHLNVKLKIMICLSVLKVSF